MTYFHRRTSTIIGAKAFHGPVRDGKEWDHLAMVVKRNRVFWRLCRPTERIWEEAPRLAGLARGVIKVWVHTRRTGRECCAPVDRKSTRLNSSHSCAYRIPSSA